MGAKKEERMKEKKRLNNTLSWSILEKEQSYIIVQSYSLFMCYKREYFVIAILIEAILIS